MTRDATMPATIEHRIGPTGRLTVKVTDWDLELVGGSDDIVRVRDAAGKALPEDLEVERRADSLSIRQPSRFPGGDVVLGERSGDRRLRIELPARAVVNIQSASGDVAASGLRGEQNIRTASGDLQLDAVGDGDVTAETVSGDISIRIDGTIALAVKTVSGDVSVEGGRVERIRLTTTSGDARLTTQLGAGPHAIVTVSGDAVLHANHGLRITAVTVAGDLRSDVPHTAEGGPGRRSLVVGDGSAELQFRSVSGDLRVLDPASAGSGLGIPVPLPPIAPEPPPPPAPPIAPAGVATETETADEPDAAEASRLEILRALESGEIGVAEATDRLARLEGATDD